MESMLGHVGEGGGTSGAMFGGNIGPFHAVRAVTVAKRREYSTRINRKITTDAKRIFQIAVAVRVATVL